MKKAILSLVLLWLMLPMAVLAAGQYELKQYDISTRLMRSTFKIHGKTAKGNDTVGTIFVVAEPSKKYPGRGYYVLITAAHVLEEIAGDNATIILRQIIDNTFVRYPYPVKIREGGKPLWVRHPKGDVAAMRLGLPQDIDIHMITTDLFATDDMLNEFEIHPGDELFVLGYPYNVEANEAGFPILRSGKIASFPLTPTDTTRTLLLDFPIYAGNSGGPVFLYSQNRFYNNSTHIGIVKFLVGVVSQELKVPEQLKTLNEFIIREHKLGLAVVVHARFLKDIIELLPPIQE